MFPGLTWAFAPPIPKLLTPTRSVRSVGHGINSTGTFNLAVSNGTSQTVSEVKSCLLLLPTFRVGFFKIDVGGDLTLLQGKHHFDNTCDAGCSLRMAKVGFDLTDLALANTKVAK